MTITIILKRLLLHVTLHTFPTNLEAQATLQILETLTNQNHQLHTNQLNTITKSRNIKHHSYNQTSSNTEPF